FIDSRISEKDDEEAKVTTISVDSFGAKGDGSTDDTDIYGTLLASDDTSDYSKDSRHWIIFNSVQNLVVGGAGDDCISIVTGSQKVLATGITCGPGHGISIGSLGAGNSEAHVSDINVNGAKLSGTTNGLRIKTWQGGSGSASNIKFQNVVMNGVKNPIIIDQNYCDQETPCKDQHVITPPGIENCIQSVGRMKERAFDRKEFPAISDFFSDFEFT
ncbi:hypothetical protein HAX54_032287, partial [Datura stramonium]|nr:hypothetical protein [Datura stramonium]